MSRAGEIQNIVRISPPSTAASLDEVKARVRARQRRRTLVASFTTTGMRKAN